LRRLKAPDHSSGKKCKCVGCGAELVIPEPIFGADVLAESEPYRVQPEPRQPQPSPRTGQVRRPCPACRQLIPDAAEQCPYCGESTAETQRERRTAHGRPGPSWERDGAGIDTFFETAWSVLTEPSRFFRRMRRDGDIGGPMLFAVIGGTIGVIASVAYQWIIFSILPQAPGQPKFMVLGSIGLVALVCASIIVPVFIAVGCLLASGILHVLLLIVGGAEQPWETTFRVYAYALGATSLLDLVPCCGGLIAAFWMLAAVIIGLSKAHGISTGRAALAVFLPALVACGLVVAVGVALVAIGGIAAVGIAPKPGP
jgi:hypothetical protein